jgi:hypothetical protein
MAGTRDLQALVAACAPLWAGEAEIVRTYWDSPRRTRRTDLRWIARQCHKELCDGVLSGLRRFETTLERSADAAGRRLALESFADLHDELAHYGVFADLYDALRGTDAPPLTLASLRDDWAWPENDVLMRLRAEHRRAHGVLGARAEVLTEGGCATLFAEGMRRRGRGGADDLIAEACRRVHDDEMRHMLHGAAGLDASGLGSAEWTLLTEMTTSQLRLRIRMRDAQFDHPVDTARRRALEAGAAAPLPVDLPLLARYAPSASRSRKAPIAS